MTINNAITLLESKTRPLPGPSLRAVSPSRYPLHCSRRDLQEAHHPPVSLSFGLKTGISRRYNKSPSMDYKVTGHGRYRIYEIGSSRIRTDANSKREKVLKEIFGGKRTFISSDFQAPGIPVKSISSSLNVFYNAGLLVRTPEVVMFPGDVAGAKIYTIDKEDCNRAFEGYIRKRLKEMGKDDIFSMYLKIKWGGVHYRTEFCESLNAPGDASYLHTVFVHAGLLESKLYKGLWFYWNPEKCTPEYVEKHITESFDKAEVAVHKKIEGHDFEKRVVKLLEGTKELPQEYGLGLHVVSIKPHVWKKKNDVRSETDVLCVLRAHILGEIIKYDSSHATLNIECKTSQHHRRISGSVVEHAAIEAEENFDHAIPVLIGEPSNTTFDRAREHGAIIITISQLREWERKLKKLKRKFKSGSG